MLRLFLFGCVAITFQIALGALLNVYVHPVVGVLAPFLLGLPLGIAVTQAFPALMYPAVAVLALAGTISAFVVDTPLGGKVVNLRGVDDIPSDANVAGYVAPGWSIATKYAWEERVRYGRGNPSRGSIRVAPLVGDNWTPKHPVEVWGAGEIRDSGRIPPSHPKFWSEPGGEYVRYVGVDLSRRQIIAVNAAKEHGLVTDSEPLIVWRAPSVARAVADQYSALVGAARFPIIAWALCVGAAALCVKWRS